MTLAMPGVFPAIRKGWAAAAPILFLFLYPSANLSTQEKNERLLQPVGVRAIAVEQPRRSGISPDTVRVLALMVDFQEDNDPRTTGNGKFDLRTDNPRVIDPPPHDSAYFASKLRFLQNYFRKVSNGKLIVKGDVIGRVVTLSQPMAAYSPPRSSSNDRRLAELAIESWKRADSLLPSFPFESYDAFILFHAGVGRDFDLAALLGFDPTPNDIPSLYLGISAFRTLLQDPTYAGIPVRGGSFHITNTMILPETQSRAIESAGRRDTLQIGVNGLLAASFGSYLGLPDLFNTKTGASAIGQFGLMDVASIFAFDGVFPPEPCAWEKMYLGWVMPIEVPAGTTVFRLPAVGLTASSDSVLKIPISAREYFLVENRNRDPQRNGQRLTFIREGREVTQHYAADTVGFRFRDGSALWGSLVDVEDFDWALPGLIGVNDTLDGGGILIWHIDESVIERGLRTNEVNADPLRRGVALKEADGAQDIGQSYGIFDAGAGSEHGSPFDCWFRENPSPLYRNVFDASSFPNSNSNTGARSGVTIKDFGLRSPRMEVVVEIGDERMQRLASFQRSLDPKPSSSHLSATSSGVYFGHGGAVYALTRSGGTKTDNPNGLFSPVGGDRGVAVLEQATGRRVLAGATANTLYLWHVVDNAREGRIDSVSTVEILLSENISTPPMFVDHGLSKAVVVGGEGGSLWRIDLEGRVIERSSLSSRLVSSVTQIPSSGPSQSPDVFATSAGKLYGPSAAVSLGDEHSRWQTIAVVSPTGGFIVAAEEGGETVVAFDRALSRQLFRVALAGAQIGSLAAADLDGDGNKDVVVAAGSRLYAVNSVGAVLSGFPVTLYGGDRIVGSPLIGDLDGDGSLDLLLLTEQGMIAAFDATGRMKRGYPLQATGGGAGSLALFEAESGRVGIVAHTTSGEVAAWKLPASWQQERLPWRQHLRDALHRNGDLSTSTPQPPAADALMPRSSVYNWPNPVYGRTTQIRFFVSEDSDVTIRILDLAGMKIAELRTQAVGGLDNEVTWDVGGIQSGVYFAHVEASGRTKKESVIIKVAVVK